MWRRLVTSFRQALTVIIVCGNVLFPGCTMRDIYDPKKKKYISAKAGLYD